MSLPRFLIAALPHDSIATIEDPREVHHAVHVLRLKAGDACVVFDGSGNAYRGRVAHVTPQRVALALERRLQASEISPRTLTLIQALPKLPAFEAILRHATELGVTHIQPVVTARSVVRLTAAGWPAKRDRWTRILREAAKQCQRSLVPELLPPVRWEEVLTQHHTDDFRLMLTLSRPAPLLSEVLQRIFPDPRTTNDERRTPPSSVIVCIGPEGDFTRDEVEFFRQCGGHLASLGSRILRTETAALATLAVLQHEWSRHAQDASRESSFVDRESNDERRATNDKALGTSA